MQLFAIVKSQDSNCSFYTWYNYRNTWPGRNLFTCLKIFWLSKRPEKGDSFHRTSRRRFVKECKCNFASAESL